MSRDPIEDAIARMVIAANERGWDMEQALDAGMCEALAKAALADAGTCAAVQREREECAKVADAEVIAANKASRCAAVGSHAYYAENQKFHAVARIADAIRRRGK